MDESEKEQEKPPVLGSWNNLYFLLVVALLVQILIYYYISQLFS